jgi:hypothetical protein
MKKKKKVEVHPISLHVHAILITFQVEAKI